MILAAFDHTDPNVPVEERVALGLKRCGVSVTCKSVTLASCLVFVFCKFHVSSCRRGVAC